MWGQTITFQCSYGFSVSCCVMFLVYNYIKSTNHFSTLLLLNFFTIVYLVLYTWNIFACMSGWLFPTSSYSFSICCIIIIIITSCSYKSKISLVFLFITWNEILFLLCGSEKTWPTRPSAMALTLIKEELLTLSQGKLRTTLIKYFPIATVGVLSLCCYKI